MKLEQQSCEIIVHELVTGLQCQPQIHRAAWASSNCISPELRGFHTVAAYSKVGQIIALYAAHLAVQLQPNIDLCRQFDDLVPLLATNLQCLDQLILKSTIRPRYLTRLHHEMGCWLMEYTNEIGFHLLVYINASYFVEFNFSCQRLAH